MTNMFKLLAITLLSSTLSFGAINLDSGKATIQLSHNKANVITFPFIVDEAKIAAEDSEAFQIKSKGTSIVIIPTGKISDTADLIVWSDDKETFMINLSNTGSEQLFNMTYNGKASYKKTTTAAFETNKIDNDIRKIIKSVRNNNAIKGYSKVLIKSTTKVKNMILQKHKIFNGSKYRVEEWYIKNISGKRLLVDEASFYTKGIIAINLDQRELERNETIKMFLVINKASLVEGE